MISEILVSEEVDVVLQFSSFQSKSLRLQEEEMLLILTTPG
jgi:hypothetical protein